MSHHEPSSSAADHLIRLRGPWQFTSWGGDERAPDVGTVRLPEGWQETFSEPCRRIQLARSFGRPTGLGASDRVFLVIQGEQIAAGDASLNGIILGEFTADMLRAEITPHLQRRNQLIVNLHATTGDRPRIHEARLEIVLGSP